MRLRIFALLAFLAVITCCPGEPRKTCAPVDCLISRIHLPMIKDMMRTLKGINKSITSVTRRHIRYLPKLLKKRLNIVDINKILGIYEDHVFRKLWINDTGEPKSFTHSFSTLKVNVEHCVAMDKDRKPTHYAEKKIKDMENAFKKLQAEELLNALEDFETVLHWISFYTDKNLAHKCD